jgi:putative serine protease PepD
MSSSVLSTVLVIALFAPSGVEAQMSQKESKAYQSITTSIASIVQGDQAVGTAALVDSSGLFLTHLDSVYAKRIMARLSDGRIVAMTLKTSDDPTHLAILQAEDWVKTARVLKPAEDLKSGDRLMAVLPTGLIRAEYVGARSGLVQKTKRLMPLSEISFEAPADKIGGGLIMTPSGALVGFLNATLRANAETNIQIRPSSVAAASDAGPVPSTSRYAPDAMGSQKSFSSRAQGPADMTVAFTPSTRTLRKTLQSLIRGKDVDRPSIGVDVKNAKQGGALIQKIEPGSAAEAAGLKVGDIVIEIDGKDIADQMDLARVVMDREIGSTLLIKVRRGRTLATYPVVVGSKAGRNHLSPGSAT